jgi:hypothetical protein
MRNEKAQRELLTPAPAAQLDLVVPFTTPELTAAAIGAAETFGSDLDASIRLVKLQMVPFQVASSPVDPLFVKQQLNGIRAKLPMRRIAVFSRDCDGDLMSMLRPESVVVLATPRRLWRTSAETLATRIRERGFRVILVEHQTRKGAR